MGWVGGGMDHFNNHALSNTKSIEFIKINFSTFPVAPLLIWCKVRIKLISASTEVGVEARAELGKNV